jgi:hypothetical protein
MCVNSEFVSNEIDENILNQGFEHDEEEIEGLCKWHLHDLSPPKIRSLGCLYQQFSK